MSEQDAARYQYLKQYIEHGDIRVDGGYLTRKNIEEWDGIIDSHLERLSAKGKFSKGQHVYVCELNPEQPLWLKKSDSREAMVLDSWQDKSSQNIVYKVQYTHNNAQFETKERYVLELNAFDGVYKPEWVESSRNSISGITIKANAIIEPSKLVEQLINMVQLEKSEHFSGEKKVTFMLSEKYWGFSIKLNKKLRYEMKRTISKAKLLEKLTFLANEK